METLELIKTRRSTRRFQEHRAEKELLDIIIESDRYVSTIYALKFAKPVDKPHN